MSNEMKQPGAENPEQFTGLKRSKIMKAAAGIGAVIYAGKMIFKEAGVLRGLKALWYLNKKNGFICPGCAWPDPDDERSQIAEYCENGAKAAAEETTTKKLAVSFFKENAVKDLAALSDHEIGKKGRIAMPMY